VVDDTKPAKKQSTVRVGIVGANASRGWARDAHVPALAQLPQFSLEAVSARTQADADAARQAFGAARAFGDSLAMVRDPGIDLVAVTVKVPEHRDVVLAALAAGKHVYCEWPLGRDLREAQEMAAAVGAHSHVMIGLQALSSPAVRRARQLIASNTLGPLQVMQVFSPTAGWGAQAPSHYAYLQDKRNGATLETIAGGHTLALMEYLAGTFTEVDARASTRHKTVTIIGTGETVTRTCADHLLVHGSHDSGCVSTLEVKGGEPERPFSLELVGANGTLKLSSRHPGGFQVGVISLECDAAAPTVHEHVVPDLVGAPANVAESYARFLRDIASGTREVPDFNDAVALTRLLDAIDAAAHSGQRQALAAAT